MKARSAVCILAISFSIACSCGGSANNVAATVVGTFNGRSLQAGDAISANVVAPVGGQQVNTGAVVITNNAGLCGLANSNKEPKNSQYLLLVLGDINLATGQITAPTAPGTYSVFISGTPPPRVALVSYSLTDATCQPIASAAEESISGTVTLTTANNGTYAGTFDVNMQGAAQVDHVTGGFNAVNCPALAPLIGTMRTTICI